MCGFYKYANDHHKTPHHPLDLESHWSNLTNDELWGSRTWEAQVLEVYGLLDTAIDFDAWPREEEEVGGNCRGS